MERRRSLLGQGLRGKQRELNPATKEGLPQFWTGTLLPLWKKDARVYLNIYRKAETGSERMGRPHKSSLSREQSVLLSHIRLCGTLFMLPSAHYPPDPSPTHLCTEPLQCLQGAPPAPGWLHPRIFWEPVKNTCSQDPMPGVSNSIVQTSSSSTFDTHTEGPGSLLKMQILIQWV